MPHDIERQYVQPSVPLSPDNRRSNRPEVKLPTAIRAFATLCFIRAGLDFVFALLVGFAPTSAIAVFVAATFGDRLPHVPAEAEFFIFALIFLFVGWKWMDRDWRIRWVAMFLSGALAARILVYLLADRATQGKVLSTETELELSLVAAFNLLICCYLAFYPGMAEAFKERP